MDNFELIIENCPIIKIDEEYYVIDNGVPNSFSYGKDREILIENRTFSLKQSDILLSHFASFKTKISGVIGIDIINLFDGITIDISKNRFYFSFLSSNSNHISMINNSINININGIDTNAVIDLVSDDVYCTKEFLKTTKSLGRKQKTTLVGEISFEIYKAEISALSKQINQNVLLINENLFKQMKMNALINPLQFVEKYLSFNFKDKTLYFE